MRVLELQDPQSYRLLADDQLARTEIHRRNQASPVRFSFRFSLPREMCKDSLRRIIVRPVWTWPARAAPFRGHHASCGAGPVPIEGGSLMAKVDGGELVARIIQENKAGYCFAINGGHLFPILAQLRSHEIKLVHMRHEQATAYAADGFARMTGEAGVCMVTAGCGLTNAVTGLALAAMTNSAVVCISGQHPNTEDHQGSFQEAYGSDVLRSFAKYTKRVTDFSTIEFDMRLAFREALTPPQGVSLIEIPQNILYPQAQE